MSNVNGVPESPIGKRIPPARWIELAIYLSFALLFFAVAIFDVQFTEKLHKLDHSLREMVARVFIIVIFLFGVISYKTYQEVSKKNRSLVDANIKVKNALAELASHKQCIDAHAIVHKLDLDGNFTYVNDRFCEITGFSRDELIGKNRNILGEACQAGDFFQDMNDDLSSGKFWSGEIKNKERNGSNFWVYTTIMPILDGEGKVIEYISICTDITRIKETSAELSKSNDILKTTFENFPGGIGVFDRNQILQAANTAYYAFRGLSKDRFPPGSHLADIARDNAERGFYGDVDIEERVALIVADATDGKEHTIRHKTPDGRYMEIKKWPLANDGFVISHQDITEYETMLTSLKVKSEEAQEAANQLRKTRDAQLKTHENLLSSINSMRNGFSIWDHSGHLVMANYAYRRFYRPIDDILVRGLHISDMFKAGCEKNIWNLENRSCEEWVAEKLREYVEGVELERELTLSDGRQLVIFWQFLDNGDMISTHIDVTDHRQREMELRRAKEELERIAYYDELTGLPNRACCQRDLEAHFSDKNQEQSFAVVLIDLDNFKRVNDTEGHATGDHLLNTLGDRLNLFAEQVPNFKPYRWGGDEFIGLIERDSDIELETICQELTDLIAIPVTHKNNTLWPTVSLGIARYPEDAQDLQSLMIFSDLALYKTKELGRDGYQFFHLNMKEKVDEESQIEKDLRIAIEDDDQFELHFQPQIRSNDERITGVEALIRWHHPARGLMSPGLFLEVAEHSGLASSIGRIVFDKAMRAARCWMDEGLEFGRLAVNLSPQHIRKKTIIDDFFNSVDKYQVNPDLLAVEFLESFLLDDPHADVAGILKEMASRGVHVELDDFGTGYASLSHLSTMPIDGFKIDRSFVQEITENEKQRAILKALLSMSKLMKLRVVCEGVETFEQAHLLTQILNCSIQGYFVARPMDFAQMTEWMREKRNVGRLLQTSPMALPMSVCDQSLEVGAAKETGGKLTTAVG